MIGYGGMINVGIDGRLRVERVGHGIETKLTVM